jgi:hypothetical protein
MITIRKANCQKRLSRYSCDPKTGEVDVNGNSAHSQQIG